MPAINEPAVNAAHAEFLQLNPEALEYNTEPNARKLVEYMIGQWGPQSGESSSAWEVAFKAIKGDLIPDPNFLADSDKKRIDAMSSGEVRRSMRDPAFAELWRRYSVATVPLERTTNDPYVSLDAAGYAAIPPVERARLYAQDLMFRKATERLIQQGVI